AANGTPHRSVMNSVSHDRSASFSGRRTRPLTAREPTDSGRGPGLPSFRMPRSVTALFAPVAVARARIRRRPLRGLLAMLGIAVAAGMLGATVVGGRVSSELAVHRALAHVPADQRATRVLWSGSPNGSYAHLDGPASRALAMLAPGTPA